ncbi:DUF502 domain-containing protein [candidate division KSB1 bacterium]|nr:MAG: DUF502 domain-containing protein [candidate division KSB1 bacterium]
MLNKLKAILITGMLVLAPITLTGYILVFLFKFFDGILQNSVMKFLFKFLHLPPDTGSIPGAGILAVLTLLIITGIIARNFFGKKIIGLGEYILTRIPLANRIYIAIRQISEAIFTEKRELFKKAVLIEYPRKGIYSVGFFTQDTRGPIQNAIKEDVISVFIPTTPNPTSGYLLFVPKDQVSELDMSVEDALKLVISAGSIDIKNNLKLKQKK